MKQTLTRTASAGALWLALGVGVVVPASRATGDIRVVVNGDRVHFGGNGPVEQDGRILVPLRGVLERLGALVTWKPESQTVVASNAHVDIQLHIGDRSAVVNGNSVNLDVPAITMAGHTMVPLRFLTEALGGRVHWDGASQTVAIWTHGPGHDHDQDDRRMHRRDPNAPAGGDRQPPPAPRDPNHP